jgi:hypothetical protein
VRGASIRYQGPDGGQRAELIFEPETYRFLGSVPKTPAGTPDAVTC